MTLRDLWSSYPFVSRLLTAVTLVSGAVVGTVQAWPWVEPYLVSHRQYVRDYSDEQAAKVRRQFAPTQAGLYDVQISIAKSRRATISDRLITLEIEVPKSDSSNELIARRQQIEKLRAERDELDEDIKELRTARDKP